MSTKETAGNIANQDPPFSPFLSTLHRYILRILFNILLCQGCWSVSGNIYRNNSNNKSLALTLRYNYEMYLGLSCICFTEGELHFTLNKIIAYCHKKILSDNILWITNAAYLSPCVNRFLVDLHFLIISSFQSRDKGNKISSDVAMLRIIGKVTAQLYKIQEDLQ